MQTYEREARMNEYMEKWRTSKIQKHWNEIPLWTTLPLENIILLIIISIYNWGKTHYSMRTLRPHIIHEFFPLYSRRAPFKSPFCNKHKNRQRTGKYHIRRASSKHQRLPPFVSESSPSTHRVTALWLFPTTFLMDRKWSLSKQTVHHFIINSAATSLQRIYPL